MDLPLFKHYLNFKNDSVGLIQITEPVGFDASTFTLEQETGRLGRDVRYMSEDLGLTFEQGLYEPIATPIALPSGEDVYYLTMGLPFLLDYKKRFGFESIVEYILEKDGSTFVTGVLDFKEGKCDGLSYFSCKVIDNDLRAKLKRNLEVNVDLFSDKDLDGNDIDPIETTNILLKAKPLAQLSEWRSSETNVTATVEVNNWNVVNIPIRRTFFNNLQILEKSGIENTLSYLDNTLDWAGGSSGSEQSDNFVFIKAITELSNVVLDFKGFKLTHSFFADSGITGTNTIKFIIAWGFDTENPIGEIEKFSTTFSVDGETIVFEEDFSINIPFVPSGAYIFVYGVSKIERTSPSTGTTFPEDFLNSVSVLNDYTLQITATSTAIDSVIKGIRWKDLIYQNVKRVNGFDTTQPRFEAGGEFYDQFVFNGKLIRQFTDKPFYANLKNTFETLKEVNGDFQINSNGVFVGLEEDFYTNNEIIALVEAPDNDFEDNFSQKMSINRIEYNYKTFESDRDEKNTIDSMHTQSQFKLPNQQVENVKKIEVEQIRDANSIESARRQGINTKDTTALDNDDKLYFLDCVPLVTLSTDVDVTDISVSIIEPVISISRSAGAKPTQNNHTLCPD